MEDSLLKKEPQKGVGSGMNYSSYSSKQTPNRKKATPTSTSMYKNDPTENNAILTWHH